MTPQTRGSLALGPRRGRTNRDEQVVDVRESAPESSLPQATTISALRRAPRLTLRRSKHIASPRASVEWVEDGRFLTRVPSLNSSDDSLTVKGGGMGEQSRQDRAGRVESE